MNWFRRNAKFIIRVLIILILIECALAWYVLQQFHERYLSRSEAVAVALTDARMEREEVADLAVKLDQKDGQAWYEVVFTAGGAEFAYRIDAESGKILSP